MQKIENIMQLKKKDCELNKCRDEINQLPTSFYGAYFHAYITCRY